MQMSNDISQQDLDGSRVLPIVFLGPSLPKAEAKQIVDADYRPPIRRGDLDLMANGAVVAIIDGVFDQLLAISPREIREALGRGVRIFGSSSMGALRANEVPGVEGVGRVFDMFRRGEVENDDEVAVAFDPDSERSLSEPLVNVRHAVDRLVKPGTLDAEVGSQILRAAKRLPYPDRVYPRIIQEAGLDQQRDARQLISMLAAHDLKRDDAITLLERLREIRPLEAPLSPAEPESESDLADEPAAALPADSPIVLWEYGPPIPFAEVVLFLKLTGVFAPYAKAAVARFLLEGNQLEIAPADADPERLRSDLYTQLRSTWEWVTDEETAISLRDLGVGIDALEDGLDQQVEASRRLMALAQEGSDEFLQALRIELFLDDLALKREAARCASLAALAAHGRSTGRALQRQERELAERKLCTRLIALDTDDAAQKLADWGVAREQMTAFVEELAWARRGAALLDKPKVPAAKASRSLRRSKKAPGSRRFCLPFAEALAASQRLRKAVGITRVAVITGLGDIGIPNAQAFRPDGSWSSTVGSGKSESLQGAKVGAIMEEVEKWAQEQFPGPDVPAELEASYQSLQRRRRPAVDPQTLDLPHDSCYRPELEIGWRECEDLIGGAPLLVPSAMLSMARGKNDINYSPRGGRKILGTNGLASGFTFEEALTHAISEYIERHLTVMHSIMESNPGTQCPKPAPAIDLETVPASTARLIKKIRKAGHDLRVIELGGDISVPCFTAVIQIWEQRGERRSWSINSGHAAHPDPEVALNMAILEASQTIMTNTAGAREDITLKARSLGRHERTRTRRWASHEIGWFERECKSFAAVAGFVSDDARKDVVWLCDRLRAAGCEQLLVADLSLPQIAPARVVRVIIPGLETTNPFRTGLRARRVLVRDLV